MDQPLEIKKIKKEPFKGRKQSPNTSLRTQKQFENLHKTIEKWIDLPGKSN